MNLLSKTKKKNKKTKKKMMNLMVYITSLIQSFRLTFKVGTTWKNNFNLKCANNLWKGESWELGAE